jgi:hypothetical protein
MSHELCQKYGKLIQNIEQLPKNEQTDNLVARILIIDRMISDAKIAVENLNFEILEKKVSLSSTEQQEYDEMVRAKKTIKAFSPYIIWYNIHQKLQQDIDDKTEPIS